MIWVPRLKRAQFFFVCVEANLVQRTDVLPLDDLTAVTATRAIEAFDSTVQQLEVLLECSIVVILAEKLIIFFNEGFAPKRFFAGITPGKSVSSVHASELDLK